MNTLMLVVGWILAVFVGALGAILLWYILSDRINLEKLISEKNGDASLSRFQFLIFTFVIALSLFMIVLAQPAPSFPAIPPGVFALLGISGGSYVISKGIQKGMEEGENK